MQQSLHMKTNSTNNSFMKSDLVSKVVIERFPSRSEILASLDAFLKANNYPKDYEVDNKDSVITLLFKDYEIAIAFCKHINIEKINNKLYSKLKAATILDEAKKSKTNSAEKAKKDKKKNSCHLHKSGSCPIMERKRIYVVKNTYKSVIADTPFTEKCESVRAERIRNKMQWLQGKNFRSYIGKASTGQFGFIDNYVARDASIPSYAFKSNLRASDKLTWVDPRGFYP